MENSKPILAINFKTYAKASGKNALLLAKTCIKGAKGVELILCPQTVDLAAVTRIAKTTFAQHSDPFEPGKNTGFFPVALAKKAGVKGTLLNHAEHKIPLTQIKETLDLCKKYKLDVIVCAANMKEVASIAPLKPFAIAYEPPELIGGDISVTTANPACIKKAVQLVKKHATRTQVLCGAGVKTQEDARIARQLGCAGVLLASGITLSKNPRKTVSELAEGLLL